MVDISLNQLAKEVEESFQNNLSNGLNESEALQNTFNDLSDQLLNLDLPKELVDEYSKIVEDDYKEALNNGQTPLEALNTAVEKLHENLDNQSEIKTAPESNINLDFAITGDSPRLELMNEAMAKGLSVEDAIKYVNNQLNDNSNEFGPPTLAEFNKLNENNTKTADIDESQEINKIEATMDAEANKKLFDNTLSDKNSTEDDKVQNESNLDNKDDEIS
tara:strand:+ start:189 stop:845 length:657 start_codon:yes stop_codon:yes gene_type:complete